LVIIHRKYWNERFFGYSLLLMFLGWAMIQFLPSIYYLGFLIAIIGYIIHSIYLLYLLYFSFRKLLIHAKIIINKKISIGQVKKILSYDIMRGYDEIIYFKTDKMKELFFENLDICRGDDKDMTNKEVQVFYNSFDPTNAVKGTFCSLWVTPLTQLIFSGIFFIIWTSALLELALLHK